MIFNQPALKITAEEAAYVLPRLANYGFKPNATGKIVATTSNEAWKIDSMVRELLTEYTGVCPRQCAVVEVPEPAQPVPGASFTATVQGTASPLDALRKLGITAREGEAFHVTGDGALGVVRDQFSIHAVRAAL